MQNVIIGPECVLYVRVYMCRYRYFVVKKAKYVMLKLMLLNLFKILQ